MKVEIFPTAQRSDHRRRRCRRRRRRRRRCRCRRHRQQLHLSFFLRLYGDAVWNVSFSITFLSDFHLLSSP